MEGFGWNNQEDEDEDATTEEPIKPSKKPNYFDVSSIFRQQAEKASSNFANIFNLDDINEKDKDEEGKKAKKKKKLNKNNSSDKNNLDKKTQPEKLPDEKILKAEKEISQLADEVQMGSTETVPIEPGETILAEGANLPTDEAITNISEARRKISEIEQTIDRSSVRPEKLAVGNKDLDSGIQTPAETAVSEDDNLPPNEEINDSEKDKELPPIVPPPFIPELRTVNDNSPTLAVNRDQFITDRSNNIEKSDVEEKPNAGAAVLAFVGANYLSRRRDKKNNEIIRGVKNSLDSEIDELKQEGKEQRTRLGKVESIASVLERTSGNKPEVSLVNNKAEEKKSGPHLSAKNERDHMIQRPELTTGDSYSSNIETGAKRAPVEYMPINNELSGVEYKNENGNERLFSRSASLPDYIADNTPRSEPIELRPFNQDTGIPVQQNLRPGAQKRSNIFESDDVRMYKKAVNVGVGWAVLVLLSMLIIYILR